MPRLLLVEDAPDVALIVKRLARRMGLEVMWRADVASAWDCIRQVPPDLILLDLNLLGERGEELCRRVRSTPATAHLSIALFVPWGSPEDVVSGLEAGADCVVSKDLLGRPDAWQARLGEILTARAGLPQPLLLSCQRNGLLPHPLPEGLEALNRALRHPLVRQLGSDVLRFVLRRAVRCAAPDGGERWLEADGLALDVHRVAAEVAGDTVAGIAATVADFWQRLLGTEASAPARQALSAAVETALTSPRYCGEGGRG
jgi:DNA-binding response OmpR family regulator